MVAIRPVVIATFVCHFETGVRVTVLTDLPIHLWAIFSWAAPARSRRTRVVRGEVVECGFWLSLRDPGYAEQVEAGETTTHTFTLSLSGVHPGSLWYVLSSARDYTEGIFTTPPVRLNSIDYPACPVPGPHIWLRRNDSTTCGGTDSVPVVWQTLLSHSGEFFGWTGPGGFVPPGWTGPDELVLITAEALVSWEIKGNIRIPAFGTWLVRLRNNFLGTLQQQVFFNPLPLSAIFPLSFEGQAAMPAWSDLLVQISAFRQSGSALLFGGATARYTKVG